MLTVIAENYKGEQMQLTNSDLFDVINVAGLNPVKGNLIMTDLAGTDGASYNSGRIPRRNIVITIAYRPPIETNRNLIYGYFPINKKIRLYFKTETKSVWIDGYTEANEVGLFTKSEQSQISIICPNPFFKSSEEIDVDFSGTIALFEFPFAIEAAGIEFSRIERRASVVINAGQISTGAIFKLQARTSQILNPTIYNETTNEYFGLLVDMDQGDEIIINTFTGEKSVILRREGVETNIIGRRSSGSKWLQLVAGDNILSYSCDEGAANLSVKVLSAACYEGL